MLDIAPYGRNQLFAVIVSLDEIETQIADIRNQNLLYSITCLYLASQLDVALHQPRASAVNQTNGTGQRSSLARME